ncbi:MAG: HEAT repeat domain-containing protein [Jaaginema sp. PMC 1079.18]|nr:HEAT repeat domain-containing protein [Jaaginema sp. PMC 1080.18]MEC4849827.1 HEAT repeat domain-containing protein [Jaaginema sp. PMC 1079.18]MEC4865531.1 HEAT repeat domain-containing protein [Jaaginema sp. PMC 1078.18]
MTVSPLIQAVEQADSAPRLTAAVGALAAAHEVEAIPTLIQVLGYNNPGAAVAAVEGLVQLGEVAVPQLLAQIDGYNYGARAWANRALARIGDPRALETLLEAASSDFALSVRRAAAKGLGSLNWSKLAASEVEAAQQRVFAVLMQVCDDPEWVVRYAAVVGLAALRATAPTYQEQIEVRLQQLLANDPEMAVRARSHWALSS